MAKKNWADLSQTEKRCIYVAGAVEIAVTTVAVVDLARRSPDDVRGPRWVWLVSFLVQPFGPLGYVAIGRRGKR